MIIINFKNYVAGKKALALAKLIEKILPRAIVAVPSVDIQEIHEKTKLHVFAQHIDAIGGRATGFLLPETTRAVGAFGTLLNHSEHPLPFRILKQAVPRAHKAGLRVVLCAPSIKEAKRLAELRPEAIAFEDPKLIGSGKSITEYRTEEVKKFAKLFRNSPIAPLCGAGINKVEDIKAAKNLGCHGVLIASAIAAATPKKAEDFLKELAKI
ncbi:MAG: triose-phosphate isomerase [Nanoarchaeota archaeon]|nr:triose-phosphate isomerase [Nanoarchaeota archaeon]